MSPQSAEDSDDQPDLAPSRSALPAGFDAAAWARKSCEMSGVPFEIKDALVLRRLAVLTREPLRP